MPSILPGPAASRDAIRLALQTWPDIDHYLQTCKGIIVPLGSTEQHGPTGAIGTDAPVSYTHLTLPTTVRV